MNRFGLALFLALLGLAPAQSQQVDWPPPAGSIAFLCVYNASPPSITTGKAAYTQCDSSGNLRITGTVTTSLAGSTSNATSGVATSATNVPTVAYNYGFNGTTWDQLQVDASKFLKVAPQAGTNIIGKVGIDQTTDVVTNGVEIAPTAGAAAGITAVVSAAAEGSHVLKASAGNLYSAYVTTGATAGYFMIFNATSAPADGAVTPIHCIQAPAMQSTSLSFNPGPAEVFSTGITAVFSTTGCFTKTISATAFLHGSVK